MNENDNNMDLEEIVVKKKRSKSTKKSIAAENEKRRRFLETLLNCDSLPTSIKSALQEEENEKGYILRLSDNEIHSFWGELLPFVQLKVEQLIEGGGGDEGRVEANQQIEAAVELLMYTALLHGSAVSTCEDFTQMAVSLNLAMTHSDICFPQLRNKICCFCEHCCISNLKLIGEFYLNTLNYLLDLTLTDTEEDKRPLIKRMWEMRVPLSRVNLQTPSCEGLVGKLQRCLVSPSYLTTKEGRLFVALTFTLDTKFIKRFHQAVKKFLPSCKRQQASAYGEIYFNAWVNGSPEVRTVLETQCIQDLMTHMFVFPRKGQELTHLGHNVFAILSYLHNHRTTSHFSKILTELYMPLLWRHLRSGNNIERCNAAEVFLDVYPLEKPGAGKAHESDFLQRQHSEMVDLLTDDCHFVRIIAIKGICSKLCSAWETFPPDSVQVLMNHLLALANDGSTPVIRRTLYNSLPALFHNPDSAAYIARILPGMRDYIHDENEKVRGSFVKLLCEIKMLPETAPLKWWKVVPTKHLAARLEREGPEVGAKLAKLLMPHIYAPGMHADVFLHQLKKFIELNPLAAQRLFVYSQKVLDYKSAVRVMLTVLVNLRIFVKQKMQEPDTSEQQYEEVKKVKPRRHKKRRSREPLAPITDNNIEDNETKESSSRDTSLETSRDSSVGRVEDSENKEEQDFSNPAVAYTLLTIVCLLWGIHSNQLSDPDNEDDLMNLIGAATNLIPVLLKYYKGSHTYFAVIHLASLVPVSKLNPVSTVCSSCVSQLKQISEMTPQTEVDVIIHALCAWNRYSDIQDLVIDWLDQAFRCEGLNQSKLVEPEVRQRKVRFLAKGGKPMLALRILDTVFSHPVCHKKVLGKSYNLVHELYVYLERIKVVVDRRLSLGLPLDSPMLSDEFLLKCLYRYSKSKLILHRPEPRSPRDNETVLEPFNASHAFCQYLEWVFRVVRPQIPQRLEDEEEFSVKVLKGVLRTAANLVDLNYPDEETVGRISALIKGLLTSDCSLWFVEYSVIVMKHLKDCSEANFGAEDKWQLVTTIVPCLLSQALKTLSETKSTREQMANVFESVFEVRTVMFEIIQCLLRMYGPQYALLQSVLKLFTDALVATIVHEVKLLQLLDPVDKVSELPWLCGLLIPVVSRPSIAPLWLRTIPSSITQLYSQDGNLLASVVSLLHTLAHSGIALPKEQLVEVVQHAHSAISNFTPRSAQTTLDDSTASSIASEQIDVKNAALPVLLDLSVYLNCSLR